VNINTIGKSLYGFFGVLFVVAGVGVMLLHTGLLPGAAVNVILGVAQGNPNSVHLIQELASMLVFAGLISLWFIRHYEQSKFFHWAMTIFWALFAIAHWFDGGPIESIRRPLIETVPFALFLVVGLVRSVSEARKKIG
jgi:hypothetical protein